MYIGTDALALAPFTKRVSYLRDNDWVVLRLDGCKIYQGHTEVTREMPYAVRLAYQAAGPLIRFGAPSLYDGAATTVYAAASDDTATLRGAYLERCLVAQPHADAEDEAVGRQVWELSEQLLAPWLTRDALGGEK